MENNAAKVIIDTNLWISFLITKKFSDLDEIIFSRMCVLVFSKELLEEFISVIKRPKFRKIFTQNDTEKLIETIQYNAEFYNVKSQVNICRDVKDNFLPSLAKDATADFLITGDKDLLEIKTFYSTKIITMTDFLNEHR